MQTLSGIVLDIQPSRALAGAIETFNGSAIQSVLNAFLLLSLLHFVGTVSLLRLDQCRRHARVSESSIATETQPLLNHNESGVGDELEEAQTIPMSPSAATEAQTMALTDAEKARGRVFAILAGLTVAFTWLVFMCSAVWKLRSRTT